MNQSWLLRVLPIAAIFSFRMFGLFMLIPVFTIYAADFNHATPLLIGIALGSYGLSQGLLQIPFGMLSDRFGRKPIISLGLILFAAGSLLGAVTHSIYGMIAARIIQGGGAIGSVLIALLADVTTNEQRTKAMAVIGITIGISFSLAIVLSPLITQYCGLAGIFYLSCILAVSGLLLLRFTIPKPAQDYAIDYSIVALLKTVLINPRLQRLNMGIFTQHFILTATFFVMPLLLQQQIQLGNLISPTYFYLSIMAISFIIMMLILYVAEKFNRLTTLFNGAILTIFFCQLFFAITNQHWPWLYTLLGLYFVAFNLLEASLPAFISKAASQYNKGTAMGVYSSCQFLGIFCGGTVAGIVYQYAGIKYLFLINALLSVVWLVVSCSIKKEMTAINEKHLN